MVTLTPRKRRRPGKRGQRVIVNLIGDVNAGVVENGRRVNVAKLQSKKKSALTLALTPFSFGSVRRIRTSWTSNARITTKGIVLC